MADTSALVPSVPPSPSAERRNTHFLKQLPRFVVQYLYLYVDGVSLGRLLLSGDAFILHSLGNGSAVLDFRISEVSRRQLPAAKLLSKLSKLRVISLTYSQSIVQSSIWVLSPTQLPSTLVEVHFSFSWAEWVWRTVTSHYRNGNARANPSTLELAAEKEYDIAQLLPLLERLELNGRPALTNAFVVNLPPNLLRFGLLQNNFITFECAAYLPRSLTELRLPESDTLWESALPLLPPHLTALHLNRIDDEFYHLIPRTVTDLTLKVSRISENNMCAELPDGLLSFESSFDVMANFRWLERLPRSLTRFHDHHNGHILDTNVELLPPSLKFIAVSLDFLTDNGISKLPSQLSTLRLIDGVLGIAVFSSLPPSIQLLELDGTIAKTSEFELSRAKRRIRIVELRTGVAL